MRYIHYGCASFDKSKFQEIKTNHTSASQKEDYGPPLLMQSMAGKTGVRQRILGNAVRIIRFHSH